MLTLTRKGRLRKTQKALENLLKQGELELAYLITARTSHPEIQARRTELLERLADELPDRINDGELTFTDSSVLADRTNHKKLETDETTIRARSTWITYRKGEPKKFDKEKPASVVARLANQRYGRPLAENEQTWWTSPTTEAVQISLPGSLEKKLKEQHREETDRYSWVSPGTFPKFPQENIHPQIREDLYLFFGGWKNLEKRLETNRTEEADQTRGSIIRRPRHTPRQIPRTYWVTTWESTKKQGTTTIHSITEDKPRIPKGYAQDRKEGKKSKIKNIGRIRTRPYQTQTTNEYIDDLRQDQEEKRETQRQLRDIPINSFLNYIERLRLEKQELPNQLLTDYQETQLKRHGITRAERKKLDELSIIVKETEIKKRAERKIGRRIKKGLSWIVNRPTGIRTEIEPTQYWVTRWLNTGEIYSITTEEPNTPTENGNESKSEISVRQQPHTDIDPIAFIEYMGKQDLTTTEPKLDQLLEIYERAGLETAEVTRQRGQQRRWREQVQRKRTRSQRTAPTREQNGYEPWLMLRLTNGLRKYKEELGEELEPATNLTRTIWEHAIARPTRAVARLASEARQYLRQDWEQTKQDTTDMVDILDVTQHGIRQDARRTWAATRTYLRQDWEKTKKRHPDMMDFFEATSIMLYGISQDRKERKEKKQSIREHNRTLRKVKSLEKTLIAIETRKLDVLPYDQPYKEYETARKQLTEQTTRLQESEHNEDKKIQRQLAREVKEAKTERRGLAEICLHNHHLREQRKTYQPRMEQIGAVRAMHIRNMNKAFEQAHLDSGKPDSRQLIREDLRYAFGEVTDPEASLEYLAANLEPARLAAVDDEAIHLHAWRKILSPHGIDVRIRYSNERSKTSILAIGAISGMNTEEAIGWLNETYGLKLDPEKDGKRKDQLYLKTRVAKVADDLSTLWLANETLLMMDSDMQLKKACRNRKELQAVRNYDIENGDLGEFFRLIENCHGQTTQLQNQQAQETNYQPRFAIRPEQTIKYLTLSLALLDELNKQQIPQQYTTAMQSLTLIGRGMLESGDKEEQELSQAIFRQVGQRLDRHVEDLARQGNSYFTTQIMIREGFYDQFGETIGIPQETYLEHRGEQIRTYRTAMHGRKASQLEEMKRRQQAERNGYDPRQAATLLTDFDATIKQINTAARRNNGNYLPDEDAEQTVRFGLYTLDQLAQQPMENGTEETYRKTYTTTLGYATGAATPEKRRQLKNMLEGRLKTQKRRLGQGKKRIRKKGKRKNLEIVTSCLDETQSLQIDLAEFDATDEAGIEAFLNGTAQEPSYSTPRWPTQPKKREPTNYNGNGRPPRDTRPTRQNQPQRIPTYKHRTY